MADGAPLLSTSDTTVEEEKIQVERLNRLPLYKFQSFEQLKKAVWWSFFPEYLSLPLFYWLSAARMLKTSYALQSLFLAGSSFLQLSGFKFLVTNQVKVRGTKGKVVDYQELTRNFLAPLETIMGIPVKCLGFRRWSYDLVSLAPNYLTVITTVQAIATVEDEWLGVEDAFQRRWENVAVIGQYVGELGLPNILKISVAVDMMFHAFYVHTQYEISRYGSDAFDILSESANLLFLEKATQKPGTLHMVRTMAAPLVKVPMIWMKVSLLALLYNSLDYAGKKSLLIAICLGFYSLVPILPGWADAIWTLINPKTSFCCEKFDNWMLFALLSTAFFLLLAFGVLMSIVVVHFVGVFACPSHDLSVLHGCTDVLNFSGNASNASGL